MSLPFQTRHPAPGGGEVGANIDRCISAAQVMPPKSKSKLQLEEGLQATRAAKLSRESGEGTSSAVETDDVGNSSLSQLITMHEDALYTDNETVDPSFDLDSSVRSDSDHLVHKKVIKSHRRISEVQ